MRALETRGWGEKKGRGVRGTVREGRELHAVVEVELHQALQMTKPFTERGRPWSIILSMTIQQRGMADLCAGETHTCGELLQSVALAEVERLEVW